MNKTYQKSFPGDKNAGFTLIELLVVVLIIGILAAVALPQYQRVVNKTRLMNYYQLAQGMVRAQEMYYLANGKYSIPVEDLDVDYAKVCELNVEQHQMGCPFAYIRNITGPTAVPGANRIKIYYHARGIKGNITSGRDAEISLWLEHSSYPNKVECEGFTELGNYLCKSMNWDS